MSARFVWLVLGLLLLGGCGSGGGGSDGAKNSFPVQAAPSGLSYTSPRVLTMSQPAQEITPSVTGTVSSFSISPALPAGLSLNSTTGVISGTPTAVSAATSYTVTAINGAGSTSASISIAVNDVAPIISYSSGSYSYTTGQPASASALNSGGVAQTWSISPALPAGITFSTADGSIGGIPTAASSAATYVVTAQNTGGSDTFELTIAVDAGVLLDLGHGHSIDHVRYVGDRVASIDSNGHWVLWNSQTAAILAQGGSGCPNTFCNDSKLELAGATLAIQQSSGFELRNASDGQVLATVATPADWWKLASDGSYIAVGNETGISVWSRTGVQLSSRAGNYEDAKAFAAPNEVRIAYAPTGVNTIEKIQVPSGTVTTMPLFGSFHSWFADGGRYLTRTASGSTQTVNVFAADGTLQDQRALSSTLLGGVGQWFYASNYPALDIYEVGASQTPAASYNFAGSEGVYVNPSANTIGVTWDVDNQTIIDLSGTAPTRVDYPLPVPTQRYAAASPTQWVVANTSGVIIDVATTPGAPKYFAPGVALDVVANANRIAVATASGGIFYFDATTRQLEGTINFMASTLALSADGQRLAAAAFGRSGGHPTDRSLHIYSLPSQAIVRSWPASASSPEQPINFTLSESGEIIGRVVRTGTHVYSREVVSVAGGAPIWSDSLTAVSQSPLGSDVMGPIVLSPSAALIAVPDGYPSNGARTTLFNNGTAVAQVLDVPTGWLDENRLLLTRYRNLPNGPVVWKSFLFDRALNQATETAYIDFSQRVAADRVYGERSNRIVAIPDGTILWSSSYPSTGQGGVTPTHVVFASGSTVRIEPR